MPQFFVQLRVHVTEEQEGTLAFEGELDGRPSLFQLREDPETRLQCIKLNHQVAKAINADHYVSAVSHRQYAQEEGTGSLTVDQRMR